ncbi:MAG: arylesterase [Bacteroidota bacterium]
MHTETSNLIGINMRLIEKAMILIIFITAGLSCSSNKKNEEKNTTSKELSESSEEKSQVKEKSNRTIIFFGNSITAGYGIEPEYAFPNLVQERLDSLGYNFEVVNSGLSGETTASGLSRLEWVLRQEPDIFVLELGGNDGLRGIDLNETEKNLNEMIDKVREANSETKIILAGMMIPPNMGQDYTQQFAGLFPQVAENKDVELIPFLLKDVGGYSELNLPDGIHPNEEGHKIVLETVWEYLKDDLEKS